MASLFSVLPPCIVYDYVTYHTIEFVNKVASLLQHAFGCVFTVLPPFIVYDYFTYHTYTTGFVNRVALLQQHAFGCVFTVLPSVIVYNGLTHHKVCRQSGFYFHHLLKEQAVRGAAAVATMAVPFAQQSQEKGRELCGNTLNAETGLQACIS